MVTILEIEHNINKELLWYPSIHHSCKLSVKILQSYKKRWFFLYFSQTEITISTGGHVWYEQNEEIYSRIFFIVYISCLQQIFVRITCKIQTTEAAEWLTSRTKTSLYLLARNIIFEWGKSLNLNPSFSWTPSSMSSSCGITDKIVNSSSTLSWKIQIRQVFCQIKVLILYVNKRSKVTCHNLKVILIGNTMHTCICNLPKLNIYAKFLVIIIILVFFVNMLLCYSRML